MDTVCIVGWGSVVGVIREGFGGVCGDLELEGEDGGECFFFFFFFGCGGVETSDSIVGSVVLVGANSNGGPISCLDSLTPAILCVSKVVAKCSTTVALKYRLPAVYPLSRHCTEVATFPSMRSLWPA